MTFEEFARELIINYDFRLSTPTQKEFPLWVKFIEDVAANRTGMITNSSVDHLPVINVPLSDTLLSKMIGSAEYKENKIKEFLKEYYIEQRFSHSIFCPKGYKVRLNLFNGYGLINDRLCVYYNTMIELLYNGIYDIRG